MPDRPPIISTASASSIPMACHRNRSVTCCAGSSAVAGSGRPGPNGCQVRTPTRPPARVDGDKVRLSFVGHASWLIQTAGLNILVDPVWSERASPFSWAGPKRHNDPGIAFDALPPIDVVLVSHGHYDHLDIATLSKLAAKFSPRVITPLGNDVTMRRADPAVSAPRRSTGINASNSAMASR